MSRIAHLVLAAVVFALAGSGAGASVRTLSHDEPGVTHGVVVGDVTARTAVSADRPKTMLGREQLTWLKESLAASDATWKVIVSSVPMSIPTGFPVSGGRDGWANHNEPSGC